MRLGSRQLEQLHRFESARSASPGVSRLDEVLVIDARAGLTPADMVERKLKHLLEGSYGRLGTLRPGLHERLGISVG